MISYSDFSFLLLSFLLSNTPPFSFLFPPTFNICFVHFFIYLLLSILNIPVNNSLTTHMFKLVICRSKVQSYAVLYAQLHLLRRDFIALLEMNKYIKKTPFVDRCLILKDHLILGALLVWPCGRIG